MFAIIHVYDVDGGYGDAVQTSDIIGVVETRKEAEAYCKKYSRERVYSKPYARLYCGALDCVPIPRLDLNTPPGEVKFSRGRPRWNSLQICADGYKEEDYDVHS